ncbi:MAG: RidA family protein [Armatimonadetes bacterium]|nr:RidA family protein [Armatimonadota bacterium]
MPEKRCLSTSTGPRAIGPYSAAVRAGHFVFCSGMIPIDPATGDVVSGDIREQTRRALQNLAAVLSDNGLSLANVVKTTCYLVNMDDFALFNEAYAEFFGHAPPARSTVEVSRLPKGVLVEVEAIAVAPDD